MKRLYSIFGTSVAALALLAGVACSDSPTRVASGSTPGATDAITTSAPATTSASGAQATGTTIAIQAGKEMSAADLVRLAEPAVVRIETSGGVGSGFIVSEDGYLITNNHVVSTSSGRAATSVQVRLSDGTDTTGKVVGADARSDLAVVKLDGARKYTALKLANLADVQVGQDVIAIGYALDLAGGEGPSYSVTRGIVSAKNRAIDETSQILGAIQTDTAINHGNSGGPLISLYGEVVGVNTALQPDQTTGGVAQGIGYAVGSDTVRAVYEQIKATGSVNRGLLGIRDFEALRPAKARELGLPETTSGVWLAKSTSVATGGPAAAAGLKAGDVILKIDGNVLRSESDLAVQMIRLSPGKQVQVEFFRSGKTQTVTVTLGTPSQ
ncbi:MAG: trypsin-like peptidase domain-containing protein [Dehalococcoidia bacterium]